jgi:hypothetical protein
MTTGDNTAELMPERIDELLQGVVEAYEQWKNGSSSNDYRSLETAAGAVYYAIKGYDHD